MKTVLWAALSANGNYAHNNPQLPPKPEALADFAAHVRLANNFIVGRRTYEAFGAGAGPDNPFEGVDIVLLSKSVDAIPGAFSAASPQAALDLLASRGHKAALLVGGEAVHNAFLADDLVDELVFNVTPVLEGKDMNVLLPSGRYKTARLLEYKDIGGEIIQLRYAIDRS